MTVNEIVPTLLAACPSANERWNDHLAFWGNDERGLYNDVGVFAHHAVEKFARGETEEFAALFDAVEDMLQSEDDRVKDLAVVGLIEDIQNVASHRPHGYIVFVPWLGPRSREAWAEVDHAWDGVTSLPDMIRRERG